MQEMNFLDQIQKAWISRQYRITLREVANGILAGRAGKPISAEELAKEADQKARALLQLIANEEQH